VDDGGAFLGVWVEKPICPPLLQLSKGFVDFHQVIWVVGFERYSCATSQASRGRFVCVHRRHPTSVRRACPSRLTVQSREQEAEVDLVKSRTLFTDYSLSVIALLLCLSLNDCISLRIALCRAGARSRHPRRRAARPCVSIAVGYQSGPCHVSLAIETMCRTYAASLACVAMSSSCSV
jgi:hypothetical protein